MTWWEGVIAGIAGTFALQTGAIFYVIQRIKRNPQAAVGIAMSTLTGKRGSRR